jgi:amidase
LILFNKKLQKIRKYYHLATFSCENDKVLFDDNLILDARPMIGVIGTAPAAGEEIPTGTPGAHGGNMDCKEIV